MWSIQSFLPKSSYCTAARHVKVQSEEEKKSLPINEGKSFVPSDPSLLTLGEDPPSEKAVRKLLTKLLKQFGMEGRDQSDEVNNKKRAKSAGVVLKKKKVWTFAFSNDGFPANYIDEHGHLVGQSVDMVKKICEMAKRQCRMIIVPRANCWDDTTSPGTSKVLNEHEFDICANLVENPDRRLGYTFPRQSIYKIPHPVIIARPSSSISLESLRGCHNYTVAYPSLTAVNRDCFLAAGFYVRLSKARPVVATGSIVAALHKIVDLVLNNEVDIGLVMPRLLSRDNEVKILGESPCLNVAIGLNMMARVDDLDFLSWWENTLTRFICKGGKSYEKFCREQHQKYGVDPLCFEPGTEADCTFYVGYSDLPPSPSTGYIADPCL